MGRGLPSAFVVCGCVRTFLRLLGFLRPYRAGVVASLVLAALAMAATVAMPWLTGRAVDQIDAGDRDGLERLVMAIVLVALARLAFSVARRLVAGQVSLGVEYDLRNGLYAHLQELELAFFDRQQTGQLMSRLTVDLQSVRFFLGYGLVFILQSALTILLAAHRDARAPAGAGGAVADPRAVRGAGRRALRAPLAARAARRSSSASPS